MKCFWFTLFPELVRENLKWGVVGAALEKGLFETAIFNPRDFADNDYGATDDRPFGGADGMVQKAEPWAQCLEASGLLRKDNCRLIMPSPSGKPWSAQIARELAENAMNIGFFCGRYSGFDERFTQIFEIEEYSLGDYVVSGGELPSLIFFDSIARFCQGVLGHNESANCDSFEGSGWLEPPLFTRPREWRGVSVPEVLCSGHHAKIEEVQWAVSFIKTWLRRPDLLTAQQLQMKPKAFKILQSLHPSELKAFYLSAEELASLGTNEY